MSDQLLPDSTSPPVLRQGLGNPVGGAGRAARTAPVLLAIFMATMILPVSVDIAGTRLTPIRVLLLLSFIPLVVKLISGRSVRVVAADILLSLFCIWMIVSLVVLHGTARLPFAIVSAIEIMGGYLLGRFLIRNIADFRFLVSLHLLAMIIMFPFALIEFTTGQQIWARMLDMVGDVVYRAGSSRPRMGFDRVLVGFEHPILFGIFCSMIFGLSFYVWRDRIVRACAQSGFVFVMTFMSLSAGAVISVMLQMLLVIWDWVMKGRWKLLAALSLGMYLFLEVASNRGPLIIFIDTLTFNQGTAWTRVAQWEYGSAEVLRNPLYGIGISSNWERPSWLFTSSVDSYWLVIAMRHGFPAITALCLAVVFVAIRIMRTRDLPPDADNIRTGYMIFLLGVSFSMATVHLWDASVVYFYFFLGAGLWIAEAGGTAETDGDAGQQADGRHEGNRYSRFSPREGRMTGSDRTP